MSLNLKNVFISVFAFCNFFNTINAENKDNHTIISGDTLITKDNRLISSFRNDSSYPVFQDDDFELIGKLRNMPNIEVGKGVTFMPSDKWYKMTIRFRMQNMVGLYFDDDFGLNKTEAQVKRLRLRFDGYIYSPKLTYTIQLGFSPYDAKTLPNENVNAVRDAMVYYVPSSTWNIGFGQTKIKANRARVNSSSALQFVDRSIVNSEFNLDRDFGFFAEYNKVLFADFNIGVKAALTAGDGRNFQGAHKSGLFFMRCVPHHLAAPLCEFAWPAALWLSWCWL